MKLFITFTMLIGLAFLFNSCTKDKVVEEPLECGEVVTYIGHIKAIVDNKCAYAGCHNGGGGAPGDYTNFAGISIVTGAGSFENRVIESFGIPGFGMPDPNVVLSELLLTDDEIQLIRCWRDNDYKEQ